MTNNSWSVELPLVMLGIRAAPRDSDGISSAERVFGSPLCLPGDFLDSPKPPPYNFLRRMRRICKIPITRPHCPVAIVHPVFPMIC